MSSGLKTSNPSSSQSFSKSSSSIVGSSSISVVPKGMSHTNPDLIQAALAKLQESVRPLATSLHHQGSSVHQISPGGHIPSLGGRSSLGGAGSQSSLGDFMSLSSRSSSMGQLSSLMGVGGGGGRAGMMGVSGDMGGKSVNKLPPEEERYNRRFSRPTHAGGGRPASFKRLT